MVVYAFNPRTRRQEQEDLCESEVILVYLVSSKTARARQKNPDSEIKITE